jgi:methylated-DNA-[protein]-cysteine S-methyltransferase
MRAIKQRIGNMKLARRLDIRAGKIETPIGDAVVVVDDSGYVRAFDWVNHQERMIRLLCRQYGFTPQFRARDLPLEIREQIDSYFGGDLDALAGIPCKTSGTAFQRGVWKALRDIAAGTTETYGHLALRLGRPGAARAVGLANSANPIGVIVTCHRVIGSDGSLTGYGGGLERKRWLLAHEGAAVAGTHVNGEAS